ncbi:MAG: hypothetical protein ABI374_04000, partial [Ginsengibacter sp.]
MIKIKAIHLKTLVSAEFNIHLRRATITFYDLQFTIHLPIAIGTPFTIHLKSFTLLLKKKNLFMKNPKFQKILPHIIAVVIFLIVAVIYA